MSVPYPGRPSWAASHPPLRTPLTRSDTAREFPRDLPARVLMSDRPRTRSRFAAGVAGRRGWGGARRLIPAAARRDSLIALLAERFGAVDTPVTGADCVAIERCAWKVSRHLELTF